MLLEEARWFGDVMRQMEPARIFPMCDVGSSSERFRTEEQPWIDDYIFRPARERGYVISHMDRRDEPGVDIVGDLADDDFLERLIRMKFQSIFCSNLLEHVVGREAIATALAASVSAGGYLFVSCPFRFPFHPDPIDTMFRPGPEELAALFPGTRIYRQAIIAGGTYLRVATRRPRSFVRKATRFGASVSGPERLWAATRQIPWLFRTFQETCLVLQKA